jgi:phosphohistidine phosphatase
LGNATPQGSGSGTASGSVIVRFLWSMRSAGWTDWRDHRATRPARTLSPINRGRSVRSTARPPRTPAGRIGLPLAITSLGRGWDMKTLLLVRHAKSSRDDPALADRDRPLDDRGKADAPRMGKRLARRHLKPDLVLSSPALRALATAQLIADEVGYRHEDIVVDERLYASSADALIAVVGALDRKFDCVMLCGHNPELTDLAHRLSHDVTGMPTCAVAAFRFDTKTWSRVGELAPAEVEVDTPKH